MSSASTRPSASSNGVSTVGSVGTPARIRASASSALMSFCAGFAEVALMGMGRSLGRVDGDLGRLHAEPDLATFGEIEVAYRGGPDLRDDRHLALDAHEIGRASCRGRV